MNKITEPQLLDFVSDVGEFEKEHRKYSSFYCNVTYTITEEDVKSFAEEDNIDASDFLNICITRNGMWDDSNGTEWDDTSYYKVEDYEEVVPEVIIPEHTVTKQKYVEFKPEFGE